MKVQSTNTAPLSTTKSDLDKVSIKGSKKSEAKSPEELASSAKVDISSRAQDMKRIKELALNTPDVDEAKVAKYQKLIDEGKYNVDAKAVADRMVDEHLMMTE